MYHDSYRPENSTMSTNNQSLAFAASLPDDTARAASRTRRQRLQIEETPQRPMCQTSPQYNQSTSSELARSQQAPLPASPSTKRKRGIITLVPTTPTTTSISSAQQTESPQAPAPSKVEEAPSPRSRVASKLGELSLDNSDNAINVELNAWREKNRSVNFPGWEEHAVTLDEDALETAIEEGQDDVVNDEDRRSKVEALKAEIKDSGVLSRKKRATNREGVGVGDVEMAAPRDDSEVKKHITRHCIDLQNSNPKTKFLLDEMTREDEAATKKETDDDSSPSSSFTFSSSVASASISPSRRFRSPPPPTIVLEGDIVYDDDDDDEQMDVQPTNEQSTADDEEEDTDTEESGIGYKPTPSQLYLRNQKRLQQIRDYKARESRDARSKRSERRRRLSAGNFTGSARSSASSLTAIPTAEHNEEDVQAESRRVHFA